MEPRDHPTAGPAVPTAANPGSATRQVEVQHAPERTRYEILVDGKVAGSAHYTPVEGRFAFDHTVIDEAYAGQGLAKVLAAGALDDVRAHGARIVPLCEFIAGWLGKHPEYDDLVDHALLDRILASG